MRHKCDGSIKACPRSVGLLTGLVMAAVWLLTACGGGVSGGDSSGELDQDLGSNLADYMLLDLASGQIHSQRSIDDLESNSDYRDRYVVFRAVPAGVVSIGQDAGTFGRQGDELRTSVQLGRFYLAAFELTQAQWQRLVDSSPWSEIPDSIVTSLSSEQWPPAYGISLEQAEAALSAASVQNGSLAVPTPAQWERACKAGDDDRLFAWGDETATRLEIARHAVLAATNSGAGGPRDVGERQANAFGFYDMHGNIWELVADGTVRGGSWADPVAQARAANKNDLDASLPHPLVGLRPVLNLRP